MNRLRQSAGGSEASVFLRKTFAGEDKCFSKKMVPAPPTQSASAAPSGDRRCPSCMPGSSERLFCMNCRKNSEKYD